MSMFQAAERVASGVDYLNKTKPGWFRPVDTDVLDMTTPYLCVAGQVFHGWHQRPIELQNRETAIALGFFPRYQIPGIGVLEVWFLGRAWKRVIQEMQADKENDDEEDNFDLVGTHVRGEC